MRHTYAHIDVHNILLGHAVHALTTLLASLDCLTDETEHMHNTASVTISYSVFYSLHIHYSSHIHIDTDTQMTETETYVLRSRGRLHIRGKGAYEAHTHTQVDVHNHILAHALHTLTTLLASLHCLAD